jgi:hypothetical protein
VFLLLFHFCEQEAWATWPASCKEVAGVPENETVFCGIGVGFADEKAKINELTSQRGPLDDWCVVPGGFAKL